MPRPTAAGRGGVRPAEAAPAAGVVDAATAAAAQGVRGEAEAPARRPGDRQTRRRLGLATVCRWRWRAASGSRASSRRGGRGVIREAKGAGDVAEAPACRPEDRPDSMRGRAASVASSTSGASPGTVGAGAAAPRAARIRDASGRGEEGESHWWVGGGEERPGGNGGQTPTGRSCAE